MIHSDTEETMLGEVFDFLRSNLGKAVSNVLVRMEKNDPNIPVNREILGKIFYLYDQAVLKHDITSFDPKGSGEMQGRIVDYIRGLTNYSVDQIFLGLYELFYSAKDGEKGSNEILLPAAPGGGTNVIDELQYGSAGSPVRKLAETLGINPKIVYWILGIGATGAVGVLIYNLYGLTKPRRKEHAAAQ